MARPFAFVPLLFLTLAIAACGRDAAAPADPAEQDPAVSGALSAPIMSDPDLAAVNAGDAALGGGSPASARIPAPLRSAEAITAARTEAERLLGARPPALPDPKDSGRDESRALDAGTAVGLAEAIGGVSPDCVRSLRYGFAWAARLPATLPVYPRAAVQEAAGAEAPGCAVRAVVFASPVPVAEVLAFYHAAGKRAGLAMEHRREGEDSVIEGRAPGGKDAPGFVLYARTGPDGLGAFDLVTRGL